MESVAWTSLLVVIVAASFASAQSPSWGKCPKVDTVKELDINKYLGTWYEIKAIDNWFQSGKCGSAQYSLKDNGHIKVVNTEYINGSMHQAIGDAYRPDDSEAGKLSVRFFSLAPYGKYWVLDTDYTHYTVVYSCTDLFEIGKISYGWILSRERTLNNETLARLEKDLTSHGVDIKPFHLSDQTDCAQ